MEKIIDLGLNKKAYFEFFIEESYEAGLVLTGTEIKSLRLKRFHFRQSYLYIDKKMELYWYKFYIEPYKWGSYTNHSEERIRKILLHKKEIVKLYNATQVKGYTLIPLKIYLNKGKAKLQLAIGKGKKLHDKRKVIQDRMQKREAKREIKYLNM